MEKQAGQTALLAKEHAINNRRRFLTGIGLGAGSLLAGCGTIIYPDRVHQEERGNLDPAVIILDGIGLFIFLIPGVIAFAVDFSTGAIYLPEGKKTDDKEHTIFDDLSMHTPASGKLSKNDIEAVVAKSAGMEINLSAGKVQVMELSHIHQFWMAKSRMSGGHAMAKL